MNQNAKRLVDEDESDSSSQKRVCRNVTCSLDLPDEIFLLICRYLSPAEVLYSFYTPERSHFRLHRIICDYYTKIKFDNLSNSEFIYLLNLFSNSKYPLRPDSLVLSNEHISHLTQSFFDYLNLPIINSIFLKLKYLTLINCSSKDLCILNKYLFQMTLIKYLHITLHRIDDDNDDGNIQFRQKERSDTAILQFLFGRQIASLHKVIIDIPDGFTLYKILTPNQSITHIDLVLETIDDLHILLGGLIPNIETIIVQLRRSRILSRPHPRSLPSCPKLTQFTLLESGIGFTIDDIKSILTFIPSIIKLTLSIRNTPDTIFCHGPKFESILNEYLPNLRQFDYTMTHKIVDKTSTEDFIQWPMNTIYYENDNCCWIHIYSLPWPSNKDDKRELPIVKDAFNRSMRTDIGPSECIKDIMITNGNQWSGLKTRFHRVYQLRTCLPINIELPSRISKVIFTKQTHIISIHSIIQPFVRSLTVQHRLVDEREILNLARQFPNVEYLTMLFPLDKSLHIPCFQTLFSVDESINANLQLWKKLINVSVQFFDVQLNQIFDDDNILRWFLRNTDLKFKKSGFGYNYLNGILSVWF